MIFLRSTLLLCLLFLTGESAFAQLNLQLIGHLTYDSSTLAGCRSFVDAKGNEWALVGTSRGFSLVDVTVPAQPVERFFVPGLPNNWREVAVWNSHAYVSTEAQNSGITIVDLTGLPDSIRFKTWFGSDTVPRIERGHTVQARDGYLYVFGGGNITNGATIATLADPWNPVIVGTYTQHYVHDGFIRNDTLWASEIYEGRFSVIDVSDKNNPIVLATQTTPFLFNHNTELSPDHRTLFTTDERPFAPLAAYDVSDLSNITLLDTYTSRQRPAGEVHNVRVKGHFLVNPSYQGHITLVDATRPDNLVETGWYITGSSLVWDADPYLPSGIVIATAKNEGLFIFNPTYQHAAWLEGTVTDAATGLTIPAAIIVSLVQPDTLFSALNGEYKTGTPQPGLYAVAFAKAGYDNFATVVSLDTGAVTVLNVALSPVTATNHPATQEPQIFPNPFSDKISIDQIPPADYQLYWIDARGRVITTQKVQLPGIVMPPAVPSGAYRLGIQAENGPISLYSIIRL